MLQDVGFVGPAGISIPIGGPHVPEGEFIRLGTVERDADSARTGKHFCYAKLSRVRQLGYCRPASGLFFRFRCPAAFYFLYWKPSLTILNDKFTGFS